MSTKKLTGTTKDKTINLWDFDPFGVGRLHQRPPVELLNYNERDADMILLAVALKQELRAQGKDNSLTAGEFNDLYKMAFLMKTTYKKTAEEIAQATVKALGAENITQAVLEALKPEQMPYIVAEKPAKGKQQETLDI
jgi:hypothetical protein